MLNVFKEIKDGVKTKSKEQETINKSITAFKRIKINFNKETIIKSR